MESAATYSLSFKFVSCKEKITAISQSFTKTLMKNFYFYYNNFYYYKLRCIRDSPISPGLLRRGGSIPLEVLHHRLPGRREPPAAAGVDPGYGRKAIAREDPSEAVAQGPQGFQVRPVAFGKVRFRRETFSHADSKPKEFASCAQCCRGRMNLKADAAGSQRGRVTSHSVGSRCTAAISAGKMEALSFLKLG